MWIMKYCGMFDIVANVWISWKTKQIMFGVHIHWQWMIIYCSLKFMCIKILHNFSSNMYAKINTRFISHFLVFGYTSINFCLHMLLPPSPHTYTEFCVGGVVCPLQIYTWNWIVIILFTFDIIQILFQYLFHRT